MARIAAGDSYLLSLLRQPRLDTHASAPFVKQRCEGTAAKPQCLRAKRTVFLPRSAVLSDKSAKWLSQAAILAIPQRLSGATRTGCTYLRAMLGEVAWIISRMSDNYLAAQYHRIVRRRGKQKAIVAVAHSLLVIIYHVLRDKKPYTDLGVDYFDKLDTARIERHHVRRLEQLGYTVTLTPTHAA
jgi:hypothetical protein